LQEAIINLVNNAVEAMATVSDRPRVLQIKSEVRDSDNISVSVEDSRPGLCKNKIDNIFNAFVSTKDTGVGLGLTICRMIIERHGGTLSASSGAVGGARFEFVLPIKSTIAPIPEPAFGAEAA
jgi:C4-dicarboxylate-specific signal transduction histidine kinase